MLEDLPIKFSADTMGAKKAGEGWQQSLQRSVERRLAIGEANLLSQLAPEFERVLLKTVFAFTGGRKREAARWLGWGRNTLTRKLKKLDVD
jgi:two-component system nitrogen regulation response regulator GlnG